MRRNRSLAVILRLGKHVGDLRSIIASLCKCSERPQAVHVSPE